MAINTNGLTPIDFGGSTWTNDGESPVVGDRDIRGGLRYLSGSTTIGDEDRLEDIPRRRLQDGMLVYVKDTYTATLPWSGGVTAREITGDTYYKYEAGTAVRDAQGRLPNGTANWVEFEVGGGGGITVWEANTEYEENDFVVNGQSLYRALRDHTSGATFAVTVGTNTNWQRESVTDQEVGDLVSLANLLADGGWAVARTYVDNDVVIHDNRFFQNQTGGNLIAGNAPGEAGSRWTEISADAAFAGIEVTTGDFTGDGTVADPLTYPTPTYDSSTDTGYNNPTIAVDSKNRITHISDRPPETELLTGLQDVTVNTTAQTISYEPRTTGSGLYTVGSNEYNVRFDYQSHTLTVALASDDIQEIVTAGGAGSSITLQYFVSGDSTNYHFDRSTVQQVDETNNRVEILFSSAGVSNNIYQRLGFAIGWSALNSGTHRVGDIFFFDATAIVGAAPRAILSEAVDKDDTVFYPVKGADNTWTIGDVGSGFVDNLRQAANVAYPTTNDTTDHYTLQLTRDADGNNSASFAELSVNLAGHLPEGPANGVLQRTSSTADMDAYEVTLLNRNNMNTTVTPTSGHAVTWGGVTDGFGSTAIPSLQSVPGPTADAHAANKGYVDGKVGIEPWDPAATYVQDQMVYLNSTVKDRKTVYRALTDHTSSVSTSPDTDTTNWEVIVETDAHYLVADRTDAALPSDPDHGDVWFNCDDGKTYMWYENTPGTPSTGQWIQTAGLGEVSTTSGTGSGDTNQDAFSSVLAGADTLTSDNPTDRLSIQPTANSNITVSGTTGGTDPRVNIGYDDTDVNFRMLQSTGVLGSAHRTNTNEIYYYYPAHDVGRYTESREATLVAGTVTSGLTLDQTLPTRFHGAHVLFRGNFPGSSNGNATEGIFLGIVTSDGAGIDQIYNSNGTQIFFGTVDATETNTVTDVVLTTRRDRPFTGLTLGTAGLDGGIDSNTHEEINIIGGTGVTLAHTSGTNSVTINLNENHAAFNAGPALVVGATFTFDDIAYYIDEHIESGAEIPDIHERQTVAFPATGTGNIFVTENDLHTDPDHNFFPDELYAFAHGPDLAFYHVATVSVVNNVIYNGTEYHNAATEPFRTTTTASVTNGSSIYQFNNIRNEDGTALTFEQAGDAYPSLRYVRFRVNETVTIGGVEFTHGTYVGQSAGAFQNIDGTVGINIQDIRDQDDALVGAATADITDVAADVSHIQLLTAGEGTPTVELAHVRGDTLNGTLNDVTVAALTPINEEPPVELNEPYIMQTFAVRDAGDSNAGKILALEEDSRISAPSHTYTFHQNTGNDAVGDVHRQSLPPHAQVGDYILVAPRDDPRYWIGRVQDIPAGERASRESGIITYANYVNASGTIADLYVHEDAPQFGRSVADDPDNGSYEADEQDDNFWSTFSHGETGLYFRLDVTDYPSLQSQAVLDSIFSSNIVRFRLRFARGYDEDQVFLGTIANKQFGQINDGLLVYNFTVEYLAASNNDGSVLTGIQGPDLLSGSSDIQDGLLFLQPVTVGHSATGNFNVRYVRGDFPANTTFHQCRTAVLYEAGGLTGLTFNRANT